MSQVSIIDIEGNNPQIPTTFVADIGFAIPLANTLNILGDTVVAGTVPVSTVGSGNTITTNVQISQAIAASNAANVGLSAFNSDEFTVDANGFVSLVNVTPSGILTLTGNSGGPITPDGLGNIDVVTANSTPQFVGTANTLTLDYNLLNLALGSSLPNLTTGNFNVGMGSDVLRGVTSAESCSAYGYNSLISVNTGEGNSGFGAASGAAITSGEFNNCFGMNSLLACSTGSRNVAIGFSSLGNSNSSDNVACGYLSILNLTSGTANVAIGNSSFFNGNGSNNTAVGHNSASNYSSTESSNICLGSSGVVADQNTIRIGTDGGGAGQQNKAFCAGITGVTVAASAPVGVDSAGQLSSLGFGLSTQVLTSNGPGNSPTWQDNGAGDVITLSGNVGGPISPDGLGNIDVVTANATPIFSGAGNALTLDFGLSNLIIGNSAPSLNSGLFNVGLGQNALKDVVDGSGNTCLGHNAGEKIVDSVSNVFVGVNSGTNATSNQNTAIGVGSLLSLTTDVSNIGRNIAVGYDSAVRLLDGIYNICIGVGSGQEYTSNEFSNICIGNVGVTGDANVLRIGTTGSTGGHVNTCYIAAISGVTVAASAPVAVSSNGQLSSLGFGVSGEVLTSNGAGNSPTWQAGSSAFTLTGNSGGALSPTGGNWNIVTSNASTVLAGTGSTLTLNFNLANLVLGSSLPSLTSGARNVGVGSNCLNALTSGSDLTVMGYQAGQSITSAQRLTLIGSNVGSNLTSSLDVTAIGANALLTATGATESTAVGSNALRNFTTVTSSRNTVIGNNAAANLQTGVRNIALGYSAASTYSGAESSNIIIGSVGVVGENNVVRLGSNGSSVGQQNTCYIAGITGATVTGTTVLCSTAGQLGTISSSSRYKENITDMSEDVSVMNLRPVEFNYKTDESQKKKYGLIAEEVHQDFPYLCFYNEENEPESVMYHELPVLLLKEIQRLNQRILALESVIQQMRDSI